jgi:ribosomal protein L40E
MSDACWYQYESTWPSRLRTCFPITGNDNEDMFSTEFPFQFVGCLLLGLIFWLLPLSALFDLSGQSCPRCGSKDLRYSKVAGFADRIRAAIGLHAQRCRSCQGRFYRAGRGRRVGGPGGAGSVRAAALNVRL